MSPPASPRVSGSHLLSRGSLGGASGHHAHRGVVRRQLVAVHESVTVLEVGVCAKGWMRGGGATCEGVGGEAWGAVG